MSGPQYRLSDPPPVNRPYPPDLSKPSSYNTPGIAPGDPLDDVKPWWQSQTVWAGVGTIATTAGMIFGPQIGLTSDDIQSAGNLALQAVGVATGIWAIVGRVKANSKIGKRR